jgi:hypothetical protein
MLRHLLPRAIRRELPTRLRTPASPVVPCHTVNQPAGATDYLCAGQFHRPTVNAKPGRIATSGGLLT